MPGQSSVIVNYPALSVTNTCSPGSAVGISYTPPSGTAFGVGTNTVTCRVFNSLGNTNTTTFRVIVTAFAPGACNSGSIPDLIQQVQLIQRMGNFTASRQTNMVIKLNEALQEVALAKWTSAKIVMGGFITICKTYRDLGILNSNTATPIMMCASNVQNSIASQH